MVMLWRRLVVWLRSLLLSWFLKRPIQWSNKLGELFGIIVDALKMKETKPKPVKPIPVKPIPVKPIPDYNITPKQPVRYFLRKLFKR
jgi:hypothetical protein